MAITDARVQGDSIIRGATKGIAAVLAAAS